MSRDLTGPNKHSSIAISALALLTFGIGDAVAQQVALEEIIVTARKREENLQDVPMSITALTADALRDANTFGLEDIAQATPGMQYRTVGGFPEITLRGLAQVDQIAIQANVGVFIDGIFLNNRASIEFANMDLAQIEVLKGPQSALFGRNTFAGAVNYRTNPAVLGEFDASIEGELGGNKRRLIKGSANLPLGEEAAIRVFAGTSEFDGTIPNVRSADAENVGGWDERTTYGASGLFESGRVTVKAFYVRNEIDHDSDALTTLGFRQNNAGSEYLIDDGMGGTDSVFTLFQGNVPYTGTVSLFPDARGQKGHFWLAYGNIDVDLDFATVTANYSRSESSYTTLIDNLGDPDAVNRPFFGIYTAQFLTNTTGDEADQDSYEIRLTSNPGSAFDWLVGYTHYDSLSGTVLGTTTPLFADPNTLEAITFVPERLAQNVDAFYGSFNYPVTDQLNLSGEIRYTDESQVLTDEAQIFFLPFLSRPPRDFLASFDFWSGKASVDYALDDDTMLYAFAARGVKSGGSNGASEIRPTFDPETNWTYEIGVKSTLMDGRAVVNASAFYIDWTNLQQVAPPSLAAGPVTVNGTGATSKGFELDATFAVTDRIDVRLATTYADPTYDNGFFDASIAPSCGENIATNVLVSACSPEVGGNQLARAQKFQLYASGTYTHPEIFSDFDGFIRADYSTDGNSFATSLNLTGTGKKNLVNLRAGVRNENTEVAFWVDNAFDSENIDRVTSVTDLEATPVCRNCGTRLVRVIPGNQRSWGVRVVQNF